MESVSSSYLSFCLLPCSRLPSFMVAVPTIVNGIGNSSGNYIQYQPDVSANAVNILAAGSAHLHPTTFLDNTEPQSIFASGIDASATAAPEVPAPFGMVLPPPHTSQPHPTSITQDFIAPLNGANVFSPQSELSSGTQINTGGESSSDARKRANQSHWRFTPNSNRLSRPSERFYTALRPPELDIEDVTDWSTVTFFTSLYLKYNHALCPILHKPTFAHDLATRRDKTDRQFRSMLLGLGKGSICSDRVSTRANDALSHLYYRSITYHSYGRRLYTAGTGSDTRPLSSSQSLTARLYIPLSRAEYGCDFDIVRPTPLISDTIRD